jgi:hypothetical protein
MNYLPGRAKGMDYRMATGRHRATVECLDIEPTLAC